MNNVIELKGLKKEYKDFTLDALDAQIPAGFSTALIGANGAGKTTLIDVLCGVTDKSGGEAVYFGSMTNIDDDNLRNRIAYCSSTNFFPMDWDVRKIAASMELAFDNFSSERFGELCRKFKLDSPSDKNRKKLMKMSDGNRMRAYLAAVMARDSKLLVLDEPGSSLDPLARDMLCDMFREYLAEGDGDRSVIFSTHNIADMEFATDYAIFMAEGHIVESGFVEDLKEKYILVHGDASILDKAKPMLLSSTHNSSVFEGIALAADLTALSALDTAAEKPTLQQLSVGILRKAENDYEK